MPVPQTHPRVPSSAGVLELQQEPTEKRKRCVHEVAGDK